MNDLLKTKILLVIILLCFSQKILATEVINNVSTTVNTGGNSASAGTNSAEGTVNSGTGKTQVKIHTTVNGEVVEDIDETFESTKPVTLEKVTTHSTASTTVDTHVSVSINATSTGTTTLPYIQKPVVLKIEKATSSRTTIIATSSTFLVASTTGEIKEKTLFFLSRIKEFFKYVFLRFTF